MMIETERLLIAEFTMDMAQAVHENSLDEDNRRFVPDEVFETLEEAEEIVSYMISQYGKPDGLQVCPVLIKATGENIGYVQLVPLADDEWEVGYHIAARFTGNGYASEAVSAFLPVIADKLNLKTVYGICLKENAASIRVMEKCGFKTVFDGIGEYQEEEREIREAVWNA